MPRIERLRSMTSASLALPSFERCERPTRASDSASSDQPGRFAQGPEEKWVLPGRRFGFMTAIPCRIVATRRGGVARADTRESFWANQRRNTVPRIRHEWLIKLTRI